MPNLLTDESSKRNETVIAIEVPKIQNRPARALEASKEIINLHIGGKKSEQIAIELGIGKTSVNRIIRKAKMIAEERKLH